MFINKTLALAGALALAVFAARPVMAQDYPQNPPSGETGRTATDEASGAIRGDRVLPGRIGGGRRDAEAQREARRQQQRAAASAPKPPTPEENLAAAQALATSMNLGCQVAEANRLGVNAEQQTFYEATCASGPGFIMIASTPPQSFDCLELMSQAASARARDPNADVGQQCAMPHNQDATGIVGAFAHEAGVSCSVDQGAMIGKSQENNAVYEVGCAGADGYWLEKAPTGWIVTDCTEVTMTGSTCRFTTAEEQVASFQPKLVGTDASDCQVQQVRLMGRNSNGKFYEAKCAAGNGFIARVNAEGVTQQVYGCEVAQHIGGGCTLTQAAPAPATTEQ